MADFGYDVSRLLRHRSVFGTLADFDRAGRRGARARAEADPRLRAQPHLRPASLVPGEPRARAPAPSATGTSGATRRRTAGRRTTGSATSAAPPGSGTRRPASIICHSFLKEQPDLNWRNPEVRAAMYDGAALLARPRRGRVPRGRALAADQGRPVPRQPAEPGTGGPATARTTGCCRCYDADQPEVHEVVAEMRRVLDAYPGERVLIGEIYLPIERLVAYYGRDRRGAAPAVQLPAAADARGTPTRSRGRSGEYEALLPPGAWPNWVLGNHDRAALAVAHRRGAGAGGGDAAAHAARHAHALLRRGDRHAATCRSRPSGGQTRARRTSPGSASAATRSARPCRGTARPQAASRPGRPGCRSGRTTRRATWRRSRTTQPRS